LIFSECAANHRNLFNNAIYNVRL